MRAWRNVWMFHAATGGTLYCRAYWSEEGVLPTSVKCHVAQSNPRQVPFLGRYSPARWVRINERKLL